MAGVTSSYPAALDSESNLTPPNNGDTLSVADHWLAGNSGPIVAIETELGTDPAGSHTNVKDRLDQVDSAMGFKNRIIGGNFSTNPWQRGTSFTSHTSGYTADRFGLFNGTAGAIDGLKTSDAPTIAQAGVFAQHCFHVDVTTADLSIGASEACSFYQIIEGYNVLDLGFGQSGTRYMTLSFWHKHTKTGTYCVSFRNSAENRSYVAEYTQLVSDTWEKAEITIPVDTSGTWDYTNGKGIIFSFAIATGSTYQTTAGSWQAGNYVASTNQVNALDSTSNNFKIALVQLEAGDKATRFETRSVGQELALCQRYYQQTAISFYTIVRATGSGTGNPFSHYDFRQEMRAAPSVSGTGWTSGTSYQVPTYNGITSTKLYFGGAASIADGAVNWLEGGTLTMSAEL